ncbi:hypothetical protein CRUP_008854 [Coryphaenoides rupestris]|nr:hypothetical protein CRUP_008854 [Coryphaenoides rupestris]
MYRSWSRSPSPPLRPPPRSALRARCSRFLRSPPPSPASWEGEAYGEDDPAGLNWVPSSPSSKDGPSSGQGPFLEANH